jgi:hypothetical protein
LSSNGTQTLNSGDRLDGAAGTDSLTAAITTDVTPASLANIEELTFEFQAAKTVNLANATGVTSVTNASSTNTGSVTNIGSSSVALAVSDTSSNQTFGYTAAAVAGTSDSATVTVSNMTSNADLVISGIETVTIPLLGPTIIRVS